MQQTQDNCDGRLQLPSKRTQQEAKKRRPKRIHPRRSRNSQQGNQLDQIFSKVESMKWELDQLRLIDHKIIMATQKIKYQDDDLKMAEQERNVRISDIRKQCWKAFIEEVRELKEQDLEWPVRRCFEEKLEKQSKARNWCQQPSEWEVKDSRDRRYSTYQDTKQQWKEAIRNMKQCLDRKDMKGLFYL
ncbi:hypothetical protein OXYTRIMIC_007 [Oxytricha trifallax]|uniref:Uncharacterized protein n=1 Tax=Oxytricha trifallax TaxID=1172189 RepID=A0A073HXT4_9SPIT|nr:hypothetical protein OXYTRIMIC_007 [Oxytricha trifallax]